MNLGKDHVKCGFRDCQVHFLRFPILTVYFNTTLFGNIFTFTSPSALFRFSLAIHGPRGTILLSPHSALQAYSKSSAAA